MIFPLNNRNMILIVKSPISFHQILEIHLFSVQCSGRFYVDFILQESLDNIYQVNICSKSCLFFFWTLKWKPQKKFNVCLFTPRFYLSKILPYISSVYSLCQNKCCEKELRKHMLYAFVRRLSSEIFLLSTNSICYLLGVVFAI